MSYQKYGLTKIMTELPNLADLDIPDPAHLDADATLQIYQALRPVLPPARPALHQKADRLTDCLDAFDAFILDGFGVINVGMEKINGIDEFFRRAELAGKPVVILTNGASAPSAVLAKKYLRLETNAMKPALRATNFKSNLLRLRSYCLRVVKKLKSVSDALRSCRAKSRMWRRAMRPLPPSWRQRSNRAAIRRLNWKNYRQSMNYTPALKLHASQRSRVNLSRCALSPARTLCALTTTWRR